MAKLDNPNNLRSLYSQVLKKQFIKEDIGLGPATPGTVTVPAPGDLASGGSGRVKSSMPMSRTALAPGSENEEDGCVDNLDMIKRQLIEIADKSIDTFELLNNCEEIEAWQIKKLNLAADYISNVLDSLKYKGASTSNVNTVDMSEPLLDQELLTLANDVASD